MKVLLVLILLLSGPMALGQETPPIPGTPAIPEAPFGLTWLASRQAVRQAGVDCDKSISTEFGDSCVVPQLPKELADMYYAVLSFGYDEQLIRIVAVGGAFQSDRDGSRVTARYQELKELLEKKYGPGKSEHHVDKALGGTKFDLGLRTKKNWMYTEFTADQMRVQLSIFWELSKTYWRIIFEYRPGLERLRHERKRTDKDAL